MPDPETRGTQRPSVLLTERITFMVHKIDAKVALAANPAFSRMGLDLHSSRILVALLEEPRMTIGDLVQRMVMPQSTISQQLKRLERRGFVTRTRSQRDNRTVEVDLTEVGRVAAEKCDEMSMAAYNSVLQSFSRREIGELTAYLDRLFLSIPSNFE